MKKVSSYFQIIILFSCAFISKGWNYIEHGEDWFFGQCFNGENQSPIEIPASEDIIYNEYFSVIFKYSDPTYVKMYDNGHSLTVCPS